MLVPSRRRSNLVPVNVTSVPSSNGVACLPPSGRRGARRALVARAWSPSRVSRGVRSAMLCCSVGRHSRVRVRCGRATAFRGDPLSAVRARRSLGVDARPPRAWAPRA